MTHAEIIRKLIGPLPPRGCSSTDAERLKNLHSLSVVIHELVEEVNYLTRYADSDEASARAIGTKAESIRDSIAEEVCTETQPTASEIEAYRAAKYR